MLNVLQAYQHVLRSELGYREKLVLLGLLSHTSPGYTLAWPGVATLAHETGLNRKAVMRAVGDLENDGFLVVERSEGRGSRYDLRRVFAGDLPRHPSLKRTGDEQGPVPHGYRTGVDRGPVSIADRSRNDTAAVPIRDGTGPDKGLDLSEDLSEELRGTHPSRLDTRPETIPVPEEDGWYRLFESWERALGRPAGDPHSHAPRLGRLWSGGTRPPEFERAAARFLADKHIRAKRLGLAVFCSQFADWTDGATRDAEDPDERKRALRRELERVAADVQMLEEGWEGATDPTKLAVARARKARLEAQLGGVA